MITEEQIQHIVRRIVEGYRPDRIILFSSYAYGMPTEESDPPFGVAIRYPGEKYEPRVAELLVAARHFRDKLRPVIEALLN